MKQTPRQRLQLRLSCWGALFLFFCLPLKNLQAQQETEFETAMARLRIFCSESNCQVTVGGKSHGETRGGFYMVLSVPAGRTKVVLSKHGFTTYEKSVVLLPSQEEEIVAVLLPRAVSSVEKPQAEIEAQATEPEQQNPVKGESAEDFDFESSAGAAEGSATFQETNSVQGKECTTEQQLLIKAQSFILQKEYYAAFDLANEVKATSKCQLEFLKSRAMLTELYLFRLKDYERAIGFAREGLEVDSRQTFLWFLRGFAEYRLDLYEQAMNSMQEVLKNYRTVSVRETLLTEARFIIADSADRLVSEDDLLEPDRERDLLRQSVAKWQEFQDYCMDLGCEESMLRRAVLRISVLKKKLSPQRSTFQGN